MAVAAVPQVCFSEMRNVAEGRLGLKWALSSADEGGRRAKSRAK